MEDSAIIDLYWAREERALSETDAKYGGYCRSIAICRRVSHACANACWSLSGNSEYGKRLPDGSLLSEFYRFSVRIPRRSQIAWRGHLTAHWPQDRQTDSSMWERLSVTVIAPAGQTF